MTTQDMLAELDAIERMLTALDNAPEAANTADLLDIIDATVILAERQDDLITALAAEGIDI